MLNIVALESPVFITLAHVSLGRGERATELRSVTARLVISQIESTLQLLYVLWQCFSLGAC